MLIDFLWLLIDFRSFSLIFNGRLQSGRLQSGRLQSGRLHFTHRSRWAIFENPQLFWDFYWFLMMFEWFWLICWFSKCNFFWWFSFQFCLHIDHFGQFFRLFICLRILIDLWCLLIDLHQFFNFQNEMSFDAFLLNFVYKSITFDNVWFVFTFFRFLLICCLFLYFHQFSIFKMKFLLMLFFYNFVYNSITLDHFWDFSLFFDFDWCSMICGWFW